MTWLDVVTVLAYFLLLFLFTCVVFCSVDLLYPIMRKQRWFVWCMARLGYVSGPSRRWWTLKMAQEQVGPGWKRLIELAFDDCRRRLLAIDQIKEKFGTLRFYYHSYEFGEAGKDYGVIAYAEAMSARVCEYCGSENNTWQRRMNGWVKTCCAKCANERPEKVVDLTRDEAEEINVFMGGLRETV